MKNIVESLGQIKQLLPAFGESSATLQKCFDEIRQRERELAEQRDLLLRQPLAAADLVKVMQAEIDVVADSYAKSAAALLRKHIGAGPEGRSASRYSLTVGDLGASGVRKRFQGSMLGKLRAAVGSDHIEVDYPHDPLRNDAATFLFREEMKRAAAEVVEVMDYPFPDAKPLAEVNASIAALDSELRSLSALRKDVEAQARTLGIVLKETKSDGAVATPPPDPTTMAGSDHPFTYRPKDHFDMTPTRGLDVIRRHKVYESESYIDRVEVPEQFRAELDELFDQQEAYLREREARSRAHRL